MINREEAKNAKRKTRTTREGKKRRQKIIMCARALSCAQILLHSSIYIFEQ